jgi:peptidyl-prolyl cis-trans isomerase A (cyclophilin A)
MVNRYVPAAVTLVMVLAAGCGATTPVEVVDEGPEVANEKPEVVETVKVTNDKLTVESVQEQFGAGLYAVFDTSMGTVVCRLFPDKAPLTCDNLIGLAEGTIAWRDPKTGEKVNRPFYDGLTFHRVIPGFMIQGGCPLGTGTGDPGYKMGCEIDPSLNFNEPGKLAMARAQSMDSVGSQFFITDAAAPHLNQQYTLFGEVVAGLDVVKQIARVPQGAGNKPLEPVFMNHVCILRADAES